MGFLRFLFFLSGFYPLTQVLDFRVLETKALQLCLDGLLLVCADLDFFDRDLFILEFFEHSILFSWHQHQESMTFGIKAGSTASTVDIGFGVLRAIQLHHPVDGGEIQATSSNVGAEEYGILFVCKLAEDVDPFGLFLFAVEMDDWYTGLKFAEGFVDKAGLFAAG